MSTDIKNVFSNQVERGSSTQRTQQSLEQLAAKAQAALTTGVTGRPRYIRHARDAMWVTTSSWNRHGEGISLYANPSDMQWNLPRRGTVVKTTAGAVRNVWRNRYRGTYYDEGTIGITFQTGNIMPFMGYPDESELRTADLVGAAMSSPRVPEGLMNFYKFIELLDQPMLLGPAENRHIIVHHSRAFPFLYMEGYFLEDNFNFSEIATDVNRLQWNATFQIYRTSPSLTGSRSSTDMAASYQQWVREAAQGEQIGQGNLSRYQFVEGVSAIPGVGPVGPVKAGPTKAKQVKTVATLSSKQKTLVDRAARSVRNDPNIGALFGGSI